MATITGREVQGMVRHWLDTPVNAYLGSDYGQDAKSMLQLAQTAGAPEAFLQKLRADVPVVGALPSGEVNLYALQSAPDRTDLVIEVAGQGIEIGGR